MKKLILKSILFTIIAFFGINNSIQAQSAIAGDSLSYFRCSDSTIWCSGANSLVFSYTPTQILGLNGITGFSVSSTHALFVKPNGEVWGFGYNHKGQMGDGTSTAKLTPSKINNINNVKSVSAGGRGSSFFLKNDGTVWASGYNDVGQLGNGTKVNVTTATQISTLSGITAISTGRYHSLFLKSDGTVWACGTNKAGQLGDGTTIDKHTPLQINVLSNIIAISVGDSWNGSHSLFLKSDGTVWATGNNSDGQLGTGNTTNLSTPIQISSLSGIKAISAGNHSKFLKSDGTVWACGANLNKELGDGTTINKSTPVKINAVNNIVGIFAGYYSSILSSNDGTVWVNGGNWGGRLGTGNTNDVSTPIKNQLTCGVITNVDMLTIENDIQIYPNPASDLVNISAEKPVNYFIHDINGKLLLNGKAQTVDLSSLQAGIYFMTFIQNGVNYTHKLVKE